MQQVFVEAVHIWSGYGPGPFLRNVRLIDKGIMALMLYSHTV